MSCAFTIFDTPIGRCAFMWRGGLVVGAALPEPSEAALRRSVAVRFANPEEDRPPAHIEVAVQAVLRLLAGEATDLEAVELNLSALTDFERRVLQATRRIRCGETRTYGELAASLGSPGAARAVGRALGRNPIPIIIPCHRVLAAAGGSGGFSAPGGATTKLKILAVEGARRGSQPGLFDQLPWALRQTA